MPKRKLPTAAAPVYPVTKNDRGWLLAVFLFGTEIWGDNKSLIIIILLRWDFEGVEIS